MIGPVIEKPNKSIFLCKDPIESILNGEFNQVYMLATYTDKESLFNQKYKEVITKLGDKPKPFCFEAQDIIPSTFKRHMDDNNFNALYSEMKELYAPDDFITLVS